MIIASIQNSFDSLAFNNIHLALSVKDLFILSDTPLYCGVFQNEKLVSFKIKNDFDYCVLRRTS